jgi:hypothetical protein
LAPEGSELINRLSIDKFIIERLIEKLGGLQEMEPMRRKHVTGAYLEG